MKLNQAVTVLLTGVLLNSLAAAQTRKRSASEDADQKELYNYVLTMDKVQRLGQATEALMDYAKSRPELNDTSDAKSLDQLTQKFQKYPEAVSILNKYGFSPREYAVAFMTVMQASMAVGFKKSGTYQEYPPNMLKLVSKANLDFVEQHWDAIQKLGKKAGDEK